MKDLHSLAKQLREVAEECATRKNAAAPAEERNLYAGLAAQMANIADRVERMAHAPEARHSRGTYQDREYVEQFASLEFAIVSWALTGRLDVRSPD